jgi:hypothetical protein
MIDGRNENSRRLHSSKQFGCFQHTGRYRVISAWSFESCLIYYGAVPMPCLRQLPGRNTGLYFIL